VGGLTFYPPDYRAALACSLILGPLSRGPLLREAVPHSLGVRSREGNGIATLHRCTWVGKVASLRRWLLHLRRRSSELANLATCRFGPSVTAASACSV